MYRFVSGALYPLYAAAVLARAPRLWRYVLIPMLVNELQRQQHVTEHLQRELAELRSLVGQMRGSIAQR